VQTTIICPMTGAALGFELPADDATLVNFWQGELQIACPICESVHSVAYRSAYVAGVMAEFSCMPADVQQATVH
jgi:hypothetical protein